MSRQSLQRLFSLAAMTMLVGCSSSQTKADLVSSLLIDSGARQSVPTLKSQATTPSSGSGSGVGSTFTFHAFGDSGWADSHRPQPTYNGGFQRAYGLFDRNRSLLGDINYINWETTVGHSCSAFWSPPSNSTFAFLTRPEELVDAINLGFNLIGLANNHSYDCVQSPEGVGPLQSYGHIEAIRRQFTQSKPGDVPVFSGVFAQPDQAVGKGVIRSRDGLEIPVTFLSAYMGGDPQHCRNMVCEKGIERYAADFSNQRGLRVLALHSWDPSSHARLKALLRSWLQRGLIDVGVGSGPHIANDVVVVKGSLGPGVLATSVGNFIHPSLSSQPYNIALLTRWRLDPGSGRAQLQQVGRTIIGCDGETCRAGATSTLWTAASH